MCEACSSIVVAPVVVGAISTGITMIAYKWRSLKLSRRAKSLGTHGADTCSCPCHVLDKGGGASKHQL